MKSKRKLLSMLLTVCLGVGLLPATALAAEEVDISTEPITITADTCGDACPGHIITGTSNANKIVVDSGEHNITLQGVNIEVSGTAFSIKSGATVNLTLEGENTLKSGDEFAGLEVPGGAKLVITEDSSGSLEATGYSGAAGIGSRSSGGGSGTSGEIIINGGTVTAKGGSSAAGIGGGHYCAGGTITINGGNVTATGGNKAAGIGGGYKSTGGEITINGGDVTANGGDGGAGIGSGGECDFGGTITISGGTVTAIGGENGAGIGNVKSDQDDNGTITINGDADVTASGFAGIASKSITINGDAEVEATGDAGIGSVNRIEISGNAEVTAIGTGDTIGSGIYGIGASMVASIEISDGTVTADGSYSGILVENVTISGGTVTATGEQIGIDVGSRGAFSTGADGNAVIYTTSIKDDDTSGWNAIIFVGEKGSEEGQVYGDVALEEDLTLTDNLTIPEGAALTIPEGKTLTIPEDVILTINEGVTLINNGEIINNGRIDGSGTIEGDGKITGDGEIADTITNELSHTHDWGDWESISDTQHQRECTVSGCDATETANHVYDSSTDTTCDTCGYTRTIESGVSSGGGSGSRTYQPSIEDSKGGDTSVSPKNPKRGDTVTITPQPKDGYEVDAVIVTDKDGDPVELKERSDGTFTFKQPSGKVTIEVSYKEIEETIPEPEPTPEPDVWENPFVDVFETDWYYEAVAHANQEKWISGTSEDTFSPNVHTTRGMIVTILYRLAGSPDLNGDLWDTSYTDVTANEYFYTPVHWAKETGIASGYGEGLFAPHNAITREQLAVMLYRFAQSQGYDTTQGGMAIREFADFDGISDYAVQGMTWAVNAGILSGRDDGSLDPQGVATRAEVAAMLYRFMK